MNKLWLHITALVFLLVSCTELEVEETLPDTSTFTLQSIQTQLPLIHITMDPDSFDIVYENFRDDIRRSGEATYLSVNRDTFFSNESIILDVRGRTSAKFPLRSLGLEFKTRISNVANPIISPQPLLEGDDLSWLPNMRLRNSGNDFEGTQLKDLVYTQLAQFADLNVETRYATPLQVFVNNEYYGMMNLRTEVDRLGLSSLLGVDTSEIVIMKVDGDNGNLEPEEGHPATAIAFREALLAEDEDYIRQRIDEENFIDYIIFQDYVGNTDWPHNNGRAYSLNGAPFRFLLFDLDFAAFRTKNAILPEMEFKNDDISRIYQLMILDPGFTTRLEARQRELYQIMNPTLFNIILERSAQIIEDEIIYNISKYQTPDNTFQWRLNLETMRRDFERRDFYIRRKYDID